MVSVSVSYNMKLELKRQHNISDKLLICLGPRLGLGIANVKMHVFSLM